MLDPIFLEPQESLHQEPGKFAASTFGAFALVFVWATIAGLVLQLIVLPALPRLHAGNGLLSGGDWVRFHPAAVKLATQMQIFGWSVWELRPQGNAPIGIAAAAYFLVGVSEPWVFLPINAALFGLAAAALYEIFRCIAPSHLALLATLPFVIFPSAMQIYGQIHKDVFSIAGTFFITLVWVRFAQFTTVTLRTAARGVALVAFGCFFIWLVRPYLLEPIFAACASATFFLGAIASRRSSLRWWTAMLLCLTVQIFSIVVPPLMTTANAISVLAVTPGEQQRGSASYLAKVVAQLDSTRSEFSESAPRAGSNIDTAVRFTSVEDVVRYVPRALQIGVLAPFPSTWSGIAVSPGGAAMRLISGAEMLVSYILIAGLAFLFFLPNNRAPEITIILVIVLVLILISALVVSNVGTLYRMRYGSWQVLNGLGVLGWAMLWRKLIAPHRYCQQKALF